MKRTCHILILLAVLLRLIPGLPVLAQERDEPGDLPVRTDPTDRASRTADSLHLVEFYAEARKNLETGQPYQALNKLGEALQLAMQLKMERTESGLLELIGDVYVSTDNPVEAIPYYLRVASMLEFAGDSAGLRDIYRKTGEGYSAAEVHIKAREYYLKALQLPQGNDAGERTDLTEKLGTAALRSGNPGEAVKYFLLYGEMLQEQGKEQAPAWTYVVNAYREAGNYEGCLEYSGMLLKHYLEKVDELKTALLYNNMGYYCSELGRYPEALEHYTRAVEHAEKAGLPEGRIAVMKANRGVCYQNMNEPGHAKDHLNRALDGLRNTDDYGERSRIENIQALIYFNENDLYNAGTFCRGAISSAEKAEDDRLLADAYRSEVPAS